MAALTACVLLGNERREDHVAHRCSRWSPMRSLKHCVLSGPRENAESISEEGVCSEEGVWKIASEAERDGWITGTTHVLASRAMLMN